MGYGIARPELKQISDVSMHGYRGVNHCISDKKPLDGLEIIHMCQS